MHYSHPNHSSSKRVHWSGGGGSNYYIISKLFFFHFEFVMQDLFHHTNWFILFFYSKNDNKTASSFFSRVCFTRPQKGFLMMSIVAVPHSHFVLFHHFLLTPARPPCFPIMFLKIASSCFQNPHSLKWLLVSPAQTDNCAPLCSPCRSSACSLHLMQNDPSPLMLTELCMTRATVCSIRE